MLLAPLAQASSLITAPQVDAIMDVAKGYGSASLGKDDTGDPLISGRMDGIKYSIYFYGCTDGAQCRDIQFATGWDNSGVSMSDVNAWNKGKRYGKAYIDDEGDPIVEMSVNLYGGVTRKNLDDTFDWWRTVIKEFESVMID